MACIYNGVWAIVGGFECGVTFKGDCMGHEHEVQCGSSCKLNEYQLLHSPLSTLSNFGIFYQDIFTRNVPEID